MSKVKRRYPIGAEVIGKDQTHFRVWAPKARDLDVVIEPGPSSKGGVHALSSEPDGYFSGTANAAAGSRYRFRINGGEDLYPDPASRFQPDGPHGPSCVVDPGTFEWSDSQWRGITMKGQITYEMHIGTFTKRGTWRAAAEQLPELARIGITVIEMMPVAEFPGKFGWGYDGVDLFARSRSIVLIAENDFQDAKIARPRGAGGDDLDAMWNDDSHHSAVVAVTSRNESYYGDYLGAPQEFVSAAKYGFLYQGQALSWRKVLRGTSTFGLAAEEFICFIENHDQIANTGSGQRLRFQTSPGRYRALTALLLLGPWTPLLFQGEEFGTQSPFLFFADVGDASVREATRKGRAKLLAPFLSLTEKEAWRTLPAPDEAEAFVRCKLDFSEREKNRELYDFHFDLLKLRREDSRFSQQSTGGIDGAVVGARSFVFRYFSEDNDDRLLVVNFGKTQTLHPASEPLLAQPSGCKWETLWTTESPRYGGRGTVAIASEERWLLPAESTVALRQVDVRC